MSILKYNGQLVTLGNQYVGGILPVLPFLEFLTNASTNALTPVVGTTGGTVQWDMGDGSIVDSNDFSHIYSSPGEKTVKVFPGDLYGVVDSFFVNEDDLVGTFDWSDVPTIESLWVDSNPALTEIISPTTANDVFSFQGHNCDLTGTLDISGLSSLRGSLNIQQNPNLTNVSFPTSSGNFSLFWMDRCDLQELDLTGLSGLGGLVSFYDNPNLTSISNPSSSQNITIYWAFDCSLTSLDLSSLSNIGGNFNVNRNNTLYMIALPTINKQFTYFDAIDCSLNQETVNEVFSKLDTWYLSNAPTAELRIRVDGGLSAVPTDGSLNANILSLASTFTTAGQTLTMTYNT